MRIVALVFAALPLPLMAETYTVPSTPTAVTVYAGFAMVTREITIEMGAGQHEMILPDLPQWVDANSLRIALAGATLTTSRLRNDALPPQPDGDSAEVITAKDQIKAAKRALRDLADLVKDAKLGANAAQARVAFLSGLSSSKTLPSEPQALANLAQMIEMQTLAAVQAQTTAERDARQIDEGRDALTKDLADANAALKALTPSTQAAALLSLSMAAQEAGSVTASISYPANASWQPTYDVVLTRENADRLDIRRAAIVYQNSGENWEDVTLTLSTLAPSEQVVPSELFPSLLRFDDPEQAKFQQRKLSSVSIESDFLSEPMLAEVSAPANFDGPGVTYTLSGPITVAQGAEGARVALDELRFDARVFARAVPARDATAFLMAQAINDSAEPLLAAQTAQIFVGGALVGRTHFAAVPAGANITQAFGPLENLQLKRTVLDRSEGDRGLINRSNAQTEEVQLQIENLGKKAWNVELLEAIPYSEQDDLTIEWKAQPKATTVDVDDRRGLMQWDFNLAANAQKIILIDQDVRWPDGKVLH